MIVVEEEKKREGEEVSDFVDEAMLATDKSLGVNLVTANVRERTF
jgi:hypothetical protein